LKDVFQKCDSGGSRGKLNERRKRRESFEGERGTLGPLSGNGEKPRNRRG